MIDDEDDDDLWGPSPAKPSINTVAQKVLVKKDEDKGILNPSSSLSSPHLVNTDMGTLLSSTSSGAVSAASSATAISNEDGDASASASASASFPPPPPAVVTTTKVNTNLFASINALQENPLGGLKKKTRTGLPRSISAPALLEAKKDDTALGILSGAINDKFFAKKKPKTNKTPKASKTSKVVEDDEWGD